MLTFDVGIPAQFGAQYPAPNMAAALQRLKFLVPEGALLRPIQQQKIAPMELKLLHRNDFIKERSTAPIYDNSAGLKQREQRHFLPLRLELLRGISSAMVPPMQ
ncbi:MAG: hypothetical protein R2911_31950 [Caldilineaceae bacterium]